MDIYAPLQGGSGGGISVRTVRTGRDLCDADDVKARRTE